MNLESKIYVSGHRGMVGSAIVRELISNGYTNIITADRNSLDLTSQKDVESFFERERPEYVFNAAAKVGGIKANSDYKADFIYDNIMIQSNVIKNSHEFGVKKLLFLGSSCIYPKMSSQPIKEEYLLSGYLETSNDAYSIAKISGIKMCQSFNKQYGTNYISVMPTNLYGRNDNYHLDNSHVLPAMIRKIHDAKINGSKYVELWGTGEPRREFLYVDDLANACLYLMNNYDGTEIVNIGTGEDISIKELAFLIRDIIEYKGEIVFNTSMPDGTNRKLLDVSKINGLGWKHKTNLVYGIKTTYIHFLKDKIKQ